MARPSMGMNDPGDGPPRTTVSTDSVMNAKFNRPPTRDDWVDRARLVGQLDEAIQLPVTLVSAPAGYGKTTLISQWLAATRNPRAAWVSLDPGDNDPGRLWRHLSVALERVGCTVPPDVGDITDAATGEIMTGVLPRMLSALSAMPDDIVILLDDFHVLRAPAVRDQVEVLIRNLPPQAHLVICTRADPGLRLGRLRASGRLAEIRAVDLNFTLDEAATLLSRVDVELSRESLVRLVDRTEGWPAGLYLATLSLAGRNDPEEFVRQFSGGNRFVVDYLTEEVLARHSEEIREFIVSMSVLDRFSAPLCDYVRGSTGSAAILAHLERSNLFLVPLDDERHWYRFHHLFAAVARIELEFEGAERAQALHSRAFDWFRDQGHIDEAVKHALAAGRPADAAVLARENWLSYVDTDRVATVAGWLEAIESRSVADDPAAAVTAAWMAALSGQEEKLNKLLTELEEFRDVGPLPDGARSVESAIAMIRAQFGYGGPVDMAAAAQRAVELETDTSSPYYGLAQAALGHSAYVQGDLELASSVLAKAYSNAAAPVFVQVLSLAAGSLVDAEQGEPDRSREHAELAMELVVDRGLGDMPQVSLAWTALGLAQAAAGKLDDAMMTLNRGLELRRRIPAQDPWGNIHHLLGTARVAAAAGLLITAEDLLTDLGTRMDRYDEGMRAMRARLAAVQELLRERVEAPGPGAPLTDRELDVLRMLQGPLSLGDIARELFLSANTVKTHAHAIYRKLGAHSRDEAVRTARRNRLI